MKTVSPPIRVAVVGLGSIARAHLNGYRQLPELAKVTALCDVSEKAVQAAVAEFSLQGAEVFADLGDLCKRGKIDAVDICLPIKAHLDAILLSARAGKHILVEKPITLDLDEAKKGVRAAAENGVTLMVAQSQRFRPHHQKMKEIIPRLGQIVCARADINQDLETILPPNHWHRDHRGCLLAIGVHALDALRYPNFRS
jgi:predicted dehydrogenase